MVARLREDALPAQVVTEDLLRRLNHVARDPGNNLTVRYLEELLDALAAIVDAPTAIAAAEWSEARINDMVALADQHQGLPA